MERYGHGARAYLCGVFFFPPPHPPRRTNRIYWIFRKTSRARLSLAACHRYGRKENKNVFLSFFHSTATTYRTARTAYNAAGMGKKINKNNLRIIYPCRRTIWTSFWCARVTNVCCRRAPLLWFTVSARACCGGGGGGLSPADRVRHLTAARKYNAKSFSYYVRFAYLTATLYYRHSIRILLRERFAKLENHQFYSASSSLYDTTGTRAARLRW